MMSWMDKYVLAAMYEVHPDRYVYMTDVLEARTVERLISVGKASSVVVGRGGLSSATLTDDGLPEAMAAYAEQALQTRII